MLRVRTALLVVFVMFMVAAKANAATLFTANLTGSQETPPNALTASGVPSFILNDAMTALSFTTTVFNTDVTGSQTADANENLVATLSEPEAVSLLGIGLLVVGFVCRRRLRRH